MLRRAARLLQLAGLSEAAGRGRPTSLPVWTPILFCTGTSAGIFTACALADVRHRRQLTVHWHARGGPGEAGAGRSLPQGLRTMYLHARRRWHTLSDAQRVLYSIMAANLGVHLLWRIPRLQGFMLTYFSQQLPPNRPRLITFITSNFSHAGLAHLAVNMFALNSFGGIIAEEMGAYQFTAFYLTAGIASSLVTYLCRLGRTAGGRSLGASGAVIACFAATCLRHPDAEGAFIFLPWVPIRLESLLYMLVSIDVLGISLAWRWLDHWGHLGGSAFGVLYYKYGQMCWERLLRACAQWA